ncbi:MAG: hypothetical protein KUG81_05860 [Gammaproteobacteria bacterium]|jgi:hypothetical protein|nr:hypothetical protein [Gammaproteobacteria bacterium]|tara:strand:+ start:2429 stop:2725 length:297 start_codon:yes stop_codon:yes gene_type:complete
MNCPQCHKKTSKLRQVDLVIAKHFLCTECGFELALGKEFWMLELISEIALTTVVVVLAFSFDFSTTTVLIVFSCMFLIWFFIKRLKYTKQIKESMRPE